MQKPKRAKMGSAVYVLPNLITAGNLFFGYFSIIKSMQGDFMWAAAAILLASVFDILDGRVARLTNATSEFGVQFDSLCDLVSFGLAPAIALYRFSLYQSGRVGWIFCFIFLACGALRLARFNVQSSIGKANGDFTGLPIPMAAGVVACFIAFMVDVDDNDDVLVVLINAIYAFFADDVYRRWFLLALTPTLAFLMVSNIAFRSHKSIKITGIKPFRLLAMLVAVIGLTAYRPPFVGFLFFFLYAASGPFEWLLGWKRATDDDDIFAPCEDVESRDESS
ncbi:MAG: CDP-diacylglycerol--serine O-phosphatidyltransferase [Zetaproteobacteria bacterium]|nr:CDP-diacylglycerol--serine O-phosphatidyltransferase [Zetaproteobacteria bacterium]